MNKLLLIAAIAVAAYAGLAQYEGLPPDAPANVSKDAGSLPANDKAGTGKNNDNLPSGDKIRVSERNETAPSTNSDSVLASAFSNQTSHLQIEGKGTVAKILPDDTQGSRHQRFILRLDSGQTLLFAHNIDLAPRIGALRTGDTLMFKGEYAWSQKGGVIHWTHHDPSGRHAAGWLKHDGKIYQ